MLTSQELSRFMDFLKPFYASANRQYHNWQHIQFMLEQDAVWFQVQKSTELWLAITFHDAIYVPGAEKDANEIASGALVRTAWYWVFGTEMPLDVFHYVNSMILETRISQHMSAQTSISFEAQRLRDLDLLMLSEPWPRFIDAQTNVRCELAPLGVTAKAHADWLMRLVNIRDVAGSSFYLSPELRDSGRHEIAVSNIARYAKEVR